MKKKKYLHWFCVFVLLSSILACAAPAATPATKVAVTSESTITPKVSVTSVKLTLVTGSDGTADNPIFALYDSNGTMLFTTTLNNQSDLQPGQTDVYEFSVPYPFCQITGWQLTKPSTAEVDDPWLPTEIYIELNGIMVAFDRLFGDFGLVTATSPRSGNWAGIEIYNQHCQN